MLDDKRAMEAAYFLAKEAAAHGEVPVGAVITDEQGRQVAAARNAMILKHDPTAHAEILAIRQAAMNAENYRLIGHTLYVTLEPCAMCAAALVQARIRRLVFATRDIKAGAAGTVLNLVNHPQLNHHMLVDEGILQTESAQLLTHFFADKRV